MQPFTADSVILKVCATFWAQGTDYDYIVVCIASGWRHPHRLVPRAILDFDHLPLASSAS